MKFLKWPLIGVAVFALVWTVTLLVWRDTGHDPSTQDIVLYLMVLPVLLLVGYVLMQGILRGILTGGAAAAAAPAAGAGDEEATEAAPPPKLDAVFAIRTGALHSCHGRAAADLVQACLDGERPALDAVLRDDAGFPVLAARTPDLDAARWRAELKAVFAPNDQEAATWVAQAPDTTLRAMQAFDSVLTSLRRELDTALAPCDDEQAAPATPPSIRVSVLADAQWAESDLAWLGRYADAVLNTDSTSLPPPAEVVRLAPGDSVAAWIERAGRAEQGVPDFWLVMACGSAVGAETVDRWARSKVLYGPDRADGLVPGEMAAGMLLSRLPAPDQNADVSWPCLGGARNVRRESLTEERGKLSADAVTAATDAVLADFHVTPADVGFVITDADHRTSRAGEAGMFLTAHLPDLAIDRQAVMLGQACGYLGVAGEVAGLVVAAHLSQEDKRAVLLLGLSDPWWRSAALILPAPGQAA